MHLFKAGLEKCGIKTGHGLACSGLGDSLLTAALTLPTNELDDFLVSWRKELHTELSTNSSGYLTHKYPSLAKALPSCFPERQLLLLYALPRTSWSEGTAGPDLSVLQPRQPDLVRLASICERRFNWKRNTCDIFNKFHNVLWDGVCIRMLCVRSFSQHLKPQLTQDLRE
jgi:holliday junction resolvase YEN1